MEFQTIKPGRAGPHKIPKMGYGPARRPAPRRVLRCAVMRPGHRAPWGFSLLAGVLIAIFLAQGFLASAVKSPVFDETGDIAAGLSYVQTGEIRANLQHPPLLKEL